MIKTNGFTVAKDGTLEMKKEIIKIEIICAWCPDKEEKDKKAIEKGNIISHGICEECSKRFM